MKIESTPVRVANAWVEELSRKLARPLAPSAECYEPALLHPYGMQNPTREVALKDCAVLLPTLATTSDTELADLSSHLRATSLKAAHVALPAKAAAAGTFALVAGGLTLANSLRMLSPTGAIVGGALGAVLMGTCLAVGSYQDGIAEKAGHQAHLLEKWDAAIAEGNPLRAPITATSLVSQAYVTMWERLSLGLDKPVAPLPPPGLKPSNDADHNAAPRQRLS